MRLVSGNNSCRGKLCSVMTTCVDLAGNKSHSDPPSRYRDDLLVIHIRLDIRKIEPIYLNALHRYMSILFLNILTLLAPTQSADNLFHSFSVLCENENFIISSLRCFFANVSPCPLVLLHSLTETKYFCQYFYTHLIL